jgi:hypothetical protein
MTQRAGLRLTRRPNAYREKCQRSWINHADYVFLITRDSAGNFVKETNLTKATKEERIKLLEEAGIPLK